MRILNLGIYLVVFCLPLYLIRFSIFKIPTTALELLIYVLFILWLIQRGFNPPSLKLWRAKGIIWPVVLILIGVSIATIYSWDLRVSAGIWKAWFIDPILFFIIIVSVIKNIKQVKKIFYSLIFSGFIVSIISLIYLIQGKLDVQGRLQAFYNSPNYLAMYLAPLFIISFWYCLFAFLVRPSEANSGLSPSLVPIHRDTVPASEPKTRSKTIPKTILLIVNCLLLIIVLFFTKSFGALLGLIGALVFGLGIYLYQKRKKKLLWGAVFLALIIILIIGYLEFNSIQGKLSFKSRLIIWQKAWEVFRMYPVSGVGPGTFQDYFPPYPRWGVPQPHNLYLAFLLQTGIIGFIGFIWLIILFFKKGFKVYSLKFLIPLMMVMVYILVHGLVDTTYWKNDLSIVFWLIVGLMTILSSNAKAQIPNQAQITKF